MLCNFLGMLKYLLKKNFFGRKKLKKPLPKVASLWELGGFFLFSPTAQNSTELHFHFINSFIQPSLVGSLDFPISHPPSLEAQTRYGDVSKKGQLQLYIIFQRS